MYLYKSARGQRSEEKSHQATSLVIPQQQQKKKSPQLYSLPFLGPSSCGDTRPLMLLRQHPMYQPASSSFIQLSQRRWFVASIIIINTLIFLYASYFMDHYKNLFVLNQTTSTGPRETVNKPGSHTTSPFV